METKTSNGLIVYYEPQEQETADLITLACEKSLDLNQNCWGLGAPQDCRIYVMMSLQGFVFQSAPWGWRVLLALTYPLWYPRQSKMWDYAGGYSQKYGGRRVIGVKPTRLLQKSDRSIGEQIFVKEEDKNKKIQHITCHELTHACAAHLKLPMWLNEGLAMSTVDKYFGRPTVKKDTLAVLNRASQESSPGRYRKLQAGDKDALVYQTSRGYWITRYIEETQPKLLIEVLSRRYRHRDLEEKLAAAYGLGYDEFWQSIDGILVSYFE